MTVGPKYEAMIDLNERIWSVAMQKQSEKKAKWKLNKEAIQNTLRSLSLPLFAGAWADWKLAFSWGKNKRMLNGNQEEEKNTQN